MDETIRIHDTGESADVRLGNRPGLLLEVGLTLTPPDEGNWPLWLGLVWSATRFGNGDVAPCSTGAASCWQPRREDLVGVMLRIGS
jgi:hypothetical protein